MSEEEEIIEALRDEKRTLLVLAPHLKVVEKLRNALGRNERSAIYANHPSLIDGRTSRSYCLVKMPGWDTKRDQRGPLRRAVEKFQ